MPIIICESWLSLLQLSGLAEVFLQDEKRNEFFSFLVEELADVFVGVAGYFDGFVGVGGIVGDTLFEVREIGFDFDIVVVGNKSSLHEPSFEFGSGHDGYGVGGHDPFEVAGDIVPFEGEDKFVPQMFGDGFLTGTPSGIAVATGVAQVVEGIAEVFIKKAMRLVFPSLTFPRKMTLSIFFSNGILSLTKMKCLTLFKFNSMAFAD